MGKERKSLITAFLTAFAAFMVCSSPCLSQQRIYPSRIPRARISYVSASPSFRSPSSRAVVMRRTLSQHISSSYSVSVFQPDYSISPALLMWYAFLSNLTPSTPQVLYPNTFTGQPVPAFYAPQACYAPKTPAFSSSASFYSQPVIVSNQFSQSNPLSLERLAQTLNFQESELISSQIALMRDEIAEIKASIDSLEKQIESLLSERAKSTVEVEKLNRLKKELAELKLLLEEYKKRR
jgi:hypothetical protein